MKNFKGELEKLSLGKGELAKSLLAAGKSPNALANKPPYEALQGLQDLTKDMSYAQTSRAREAAFGQYNQGFEQLLKSAIGEPSPTMISQQDYDQWQQDDKVIDSFWDRIVDGLENIEVVKAMSNGMAKAWSHVNREIANEITDFTLTFGDGEDKARAVQEFPEHLLDQKLGTIKTLHNGGQNYYGDLIPILEELKANGYSDNARRTAAIKIRLNEQQEILNDADSQSQRDMANERIKQLGQDLDSLNANSLQNIQSSAPKRQEEAPSLTDTHAPQQGQGDQMVTLMAKMNETLERLSTKLDETEEKPKEGAPASVKESPHQIAYREGLKLDAELEQGATLLKVFFDELAPVTEQFGKLKEILSSLLAPEDMAALEAKTQEVAAKEGDATAQDFNGLIEMLKQLLMPKCVIHRQFIL